MPRYTFLLSIGIAKHDESSVTLADKTAAWNEATRTLGEIVRDIDGRFSPGAMLYLHVLEEERPVFSLQVSSTVHHAYGKTLQ